MTKFTVSYSRKVQTRQYENMTISLTEEFNIHEDSHDAAFSQTRTIVERWITEALQSLPTKAIKGVSE